MDLSIAPTGPTASLIIRPFQEGLGTGGPHTRYLVDSGERQHIVSADVHKLLLALQEAPQTWEHLAERYSRLTGSTMNAAEVRQAVSRLPRDWFDGAPAQPKRTPFWVRVELLSSERLLPLTTRLSVLFTRWLAAPTVLAFMAIMAATLPTAADRIHAAHGPAENALLLLCLLATTLVHELGHLSACTRAGGRHGGMGAGMYWIFPAFYADVSKAWHLPPRSRVMIDVGGLYFQSFTVIAIGAYALASDSSFAYRLIWLVAFTMLHTLNPFFKFDGYWLLSDSAGLTNLHAKLRQTLADSLRRLLGLAPARSAGADRVKLAILYAYAVLSGAYLWFIFDFLFGELALTAKTYPVNFSMLMQRTQAAWGAGEIGTAAAAIGSLLASSLWPACILAGSFALVWSMLSRCAQLLTELRSDARNAP